MLRLHKTVKQGMLHKLVKPIDTKVFQDTYSVQYQLDVMRKAVLNHAGAVAELKEIEEARYGNIKK